ncbi:MAG: IS4 family transposase [Dokdonella sp.]
MHPNRRVRSQQRRTSQQIRKTDAYAFFDLLTDDATLDQVERLLPSHRERLLPPTETLAMFMAQGLNADRSCQNAINEFAARRVAGGLPACSTSTAAYCRARKRLPQEMVSSLVSFTGQAMSASVPLEWTWKGRPVCLVDGTTVLMADTSQNQAAFPQPTSQKPGLGFPISRLLALFCLSSGAVLDAATCAYQGKGNDEQTLLRGLLDRLEPGSVLVGDALFATYFLLAELKQRGVDGVFEQHGARRRSTDFRRGRRLGERDHVIDLEKPTMRPPWMTEQQFAQAPNRLTVRELRVDGKTLMTTLLCAKQTPKSELKLLYRQRWHVELDLRNLKTTMRMEMLGSKSPAMAVKEIWVHLLAYNLIRRMMLRAAGMEGVLPRQLSFKHALQLCMACRQCLTHMEPDAVNILLSLIAKRRVAHRPGRIEPRAIKRRPKPFPLLTQHRHIAREELRLHGHP